METDLYLLALVLVVAWLARSVLLRDDATAERRARRIERKLDLLLESQGIDVPLPDSTAVLSEAARAHADAERKIAAIKPHRSDAGARLKEANDAVEAYLDDR